MNDRSMAAAMAVVVTATFTAEPVGEYLGFWRRLLGAEWDVRVGGYNQVMQELLDEASASRNHSGLNVLLVRAADLRRTERLDGESSDGAGRTGAGLGGEVADELATALESAAGRCQARWLVVVTPSGPTQTAGDADLVRCLRGVAARCPSVRVECGWEVARAYRVAEVHDAEGERLGHIPHPPEYLAAVSAVVARQATARTSRPIKVVAVDADNTLWRGVVGEVGVSGLVVDGASGVLQERLILLKQRGLLLAVVSKNDPGDLQAALAGHPDMRLRPDDCVALRASWQPKSHVLRQLAAELDLGIDSFLFLDDNPVEVAEVRAHAPEVVALQLPASALDGPEAAREMASFLDHVWAITTETATTREDAARTGMYRAQAERAGALREAPSFEAFLAGLRLEVAITPATPEDVPRLAQLTQRTNQFNAVGQRRSEEALAADLASGLTALSVDARDRFGDYGLVGFIGFRAHGSTLEVEHFLLSCRALGKRIEHRMMDALQAEAERRHATTVQIPLHRTEKNEPVAAFLHGHFGACERDGQFHIPRGTVCRTDLPNPTTVDPSPPRGNGAIGTSQDRRPDVWQRIATDLTTGRAIIAAIAAEAHRPRPDTMTPAFRSPASGLERAIADRFEEILSLSPVGADDGFFDLGGQSVQAAQVLARLSRETGHRLPLRVLFDHPTPAGLASHLATLGEPRATRAPRLARDQAAYPLSAAQRRMWFLDRYAPGHPAYHIVTACRLRGSVDIPALRHALQDLAQRHESLRARFPDIDGHPVQVFDGPGLDLVVHNPILRAPDPVTAPRVTAAPAVALDLARGPLGRLDLTPLGGDETLAVLTLHHIIADGWSLGVLWRDLAEIMAGRPLAPLEIQPLDLAAHQDAWLASGSLNTDLEYWREALRRAPEALSLPTDFPRPAERCFDGSLVRASVPAALVSRLESLARRHHTTLFSVLMAGFQALLHRWSGQDDILVGTPVSGRADPDSEGVIGCLINTVVIRCHPDGDQPFETFLEAVHTAALGAFSHQDLPFEKLVEALDVPRNRSLSPLFQVMLVLQNTPPASATLPGTTSTPVAIHNGTAKFDLVLEVTPAPDGTAELTLEFNTSLFREDTAARLLTSWIVLLEHAAAEPSTPVGRLRLLSADERSRLLEERNPHRTISSPADTIHQWFEQTAHRTPQRPAVTFEQATWTYDDLNKRANRIAHRLRAAGVTPGTPVAVCLERSPDLVAALLGILKSGGAYLPIDLSYPPERLAFMLEDAAAPVFLTQRALAQQLPPHQADVLCLDDPSAGLDTQPDTNPPSASTADDLIYIIYTSGSTGRPKGCCLTHRNVARLFSATEPWFNFGEHDVWTLFHSYAFDFSVWELWGALLYGGRLVVVPYLVSRSPEEFHALLVRERVTVLNQTPSAFRQLIAADVAASSAQLSPAPLRLRTVIFGGEALEMQSLQPWFERHGDTSPQLVNMYGITETTVHVTYRPLSRQDVAGGSVIGIPIPDLRLYILDRHLEPCPVGVPGELFVGGAGVARGYLNRPELTAQRFLPSPFVPGDRLYRTGDLARFLPGNDVEYLGRIDRQVKIRGFRIELGEIESALLTHPGIREAAVLAPDTPTGRQLVAYIVPSAASPESSTLNFSTPTPSTDDLRSHLRRTLPDYMVPSAWVSLPRFPLTANGKLDTAALPAPESGRTQPATTEPPATATEESLAGIWRTVLRLATVGRHDNFFAIGGDSILSIQVISQARQAGWPLAPRHLFEHQTIAELAACADSLAPAATPSSASSAPATGVVPLTPIQRWFLRQDLADPHWWNQAFLLELKSSVSPDSLRGALATVLGHHDAFRLRCSLPHGSTARAIQTYAESPGPPHFEIVADASQLGIAMERAHRALNMETGPVFGAVLAPDRLFLVAHHMVIDGVSWRMVIEDLEAALDGRPLARTGTTYQTWAHALEAQAGAFEIDRSNWDRFIVPFSPALPPDADAQGPNTEASIALAAVELTAAETATLLAHVPARTRSRIDELLLSALALALQDMTGQSTVRLHTEGHGREDDIIGTATTLIDTARTIGWFTALFPVEITLPPQATAAAALRATKDQWRTIPHRGLGWGILDMPARAAATPDIVFNYLGQFDSLVAGSARFGLAPEPAPPWHGPANHRAHAIEIDAFVRDSRLRAEFRFSQALHRETTGRAFAEKFAARVRDVMAVDSALAPSDFPLLRLSSAHVEAMGLVDDAWPLSPMQQLLAGAAAVKGGAALDQWHCRLRGALDVTAFRRAWDQVLWRHPMLRAILFPIASDSLAAAIQAPDRAACATWRLEDWRGKPQADLDSSITALRLEEQRRRVDLTRAPILRFTLIRLAEAEHFFLWSSPDWMLDGWSWPIVFRELSALYENEHAPLPPARPYRDYLAWLVSRTHSDDEAYWRGRLSGFTAPTPLPVDKPRAAAGPRRESIRILPAADWQACQSESRARGITPTAQLMAAWSVLLARASGRADVVFGAAFSGRPAEVPGIDGIVGPCTTNLPVCVRIRPGSSLLNVATDVRDTLFAASNHQFVSPLQVQEWSGVPWRDRLFDSLVVFQNYEVGEAARSLGRRIAIEAFDGPVHGNDTLTLVATPQPDGLHLRLVYASGRCSGARATDLLNHLIATLTLPADQPLPSTPLAWTTPDTPEPTDAPASPRSVPPRTPLEHSIHTVWARAFGPQVGVEENFFEAGGHSLLAFRVLAALRSELRLPLTPADLFQYPTIAALARHLGDSNHPRPGTPRPAPTAPSPTSSLDAVKARAARARQALGQR